MTHDQHWQARQERAPLLQVVNEKHVEAGLVDLDDTHERKPRSTFSRTRLFIMLAMTFISIRLLCALFLIGQSHSKPIAKADVCLTPECVLASAEILTSRSPNYADIDPCNDFRAYMCEGFDEAHDMRPDQSSVGSLSVIAERGQAILRHILEESTPLSKAQAKGEGSIEKENREMLQAAYGACMNESEVNMEGAAPLLELTKEASGLFGADGKGLSKSLAFLMSVGVEPLIGLDIEADEKDPDVNVLHMTAPRLGLPAKEYYKDKDVLKRYTRMISEVAESFKQKSGAFTTQFIAEDVVELEVKLAEASPTEEERQDPQKAYNPRTFAEAHALVPQVDIPALIKSGNSKFEARKVVVGKPSYFEDLSKILNETKTETVAAYLMWSTIQSYAGSVEGNAIIPLRRFYNILGGKEPDAKTDRWRKCLSHVDNGLGWILSGLFIEKAFSEESKKYGDQVILDIKAEFIRKLDASEWMTPQVRNLAISKVHNIVQKIGYPTASPDIRDPEQLQDYYANVNISAHAYFDNVVALTRADVSREWSKATEPVDRNEWGMTASTVNAYYNPPGNEIVFPAGIMQRAIFYPPSVPSYLTYGGFGAVAGHELSHAFDSGGRYFDQTGNMTDWWDNATIAEFERKAECFVEEYGNFTIDGPDGKPHHVNGRLTLGENLADAGGLSAAFNAWKRREEEAPGQLLPGLQEYSKEQVFFMSYGNVWCGKTREAEKLKRLYGDPHSPNEARVLLTVANSREFRESFGCKVKEATCKLW